MCEAQSGGSKGQGGSRLQREINDPEAETID